MKLELKLFLLAALLAAPAGASGYTARDASCAAEDMQLFYYYLSPVQDAKVKNRPTTCHPGKTSLQQPSWLERSLPAMAGRKVWKDPEEGEISEAVVWQTPVSILYEACARLAAADPMTDSAGFNDMRIRFIMSVERVTRAGLETSFGGRGGPMLATLDGATRSFDGLTGALSRDDRKAFEESAAGLLKSSRDLFAQVFEEPRSGGKTPAARYTPEARVLPGYRGVSLPVSASQAMFLSRGERVDMLVSFEALTGADTKEKVTATILQNVIVTGVQKAAAAGEPGVVQLLCNPNEAQYAALSLAQGSSITLIRRAPGDTEMRPMEIASFRRLIK
jgi:hypothetical protein